MGRSFRPIGSAVTIPAGAQAVPVDPKFMSTRGIIGLVYAQTAGELLTDLDRVRMKVDSKMQYDVPILHHRRIITRFSDSNLVPADADERLSVAFNLGPAGRMDDRYQLRPGAASFEIVTAASHLGGTFRIFEVTTDEKPIAYTEVLNQSLNFAAGAGGPDKFTGAQEGDAFFYAINTTGLGQTILEDANARIRHHFISDVPTPLLEIERMEDGAAFAGLDPRVFLIKGPAPAAGLTFAITRLAAWAANGTLTLGRHIRAS